MNDMASLRQLSYTNYYTQSLILKDKVGHPILVQHVYNSNRIAVWRTPYIGSADGSHPLTCKFRYCCCVLCTNLTGDVIDSAV